MDIYIFGLGHIGLPMACWIAQAGKHVFGIDINPQIIEAINNGEIAIEEYYHNIHIKTLAKALVDDGKLSIGTTLKRAGSEPAVFLVTVGMEDRSDGSKDLSSIISVINEIGAVLVPNDLVILRATVPPGTSRKIVAPLLDEFKIPFHLAYCPETIIETKAFEELENNPMILGGITKESYKAAEIFLRSLTNNRIYAASDTSTAEMAKTVQNLYRDVNIAFANEVSDVAEYLGVNWNEVRTLVNANPRVNMHNCGPGVGGYCLPNALGYLSHALEESEKYLGLSQLARKLNTSRPKKIALQVADSLAAMGKEPTDSTVAVLGLAMKNFCADLRYSPALDIIQTLQSCGIKVKAYDPMIAPAFPFQTNSFEECIRDADCLIITANQKEFNLNLDNILPLMAPISSIIDTQKILTEATS